MRFVRLLPLFLATALPAAGQQSKPVHRLEEPAGLAIADRNLYVADPKAGNLFYRPIDGLEYKLFASDSHFVSPTGVAADERAVYVADPGARAVFKVDKSTRSVTTLWSGEPLRNPTEIVVSPRYSAAHDKIIRQDELVVLDTSAKSLFRLQLDGEQSRPVAWSSEKLIDPSGLTRVGFRVLVADRRAKTIFEASRGGAWSDLRGRTQRQTAEMISEPVYFPELQAPEQVSYNRGIYYVVDQARLFALVDNGSRLVPLVFRPIPISRIHGMIATTDKIILSDPDRGEVVSWPLLVPIVVNLEARANTSEVLLSLWKYLWQRGSLPTTEVTLPYGEGNHKCASPSCVVIKRKLLPSGWLNQMNEVLCEQNAPICKDNSWKTLHKGDRLAVPFIPYEKYLWVETRKLDGKASIASLLRFWIPKREDPNAHFRALATEKTLKFLNPDIESEHILSFKKKDAEVNIPVLRYRYYVAVPRQDLLDRDSRLWLILRRQKKVSIQSTEIATDEAAAATSRNGMEMATASELSQYYGTVLSNMDFEPGASTGYGSGSNVIAFEANIACNHPVFFSKDGGSENALHEGCPQTSIELNGLFKPEFDDQNEHGTCVSSLIGARRLPYGQPLAPKVEIWKENTTRSLSERIDHLTIRLRKSVVINVSNEDLGSKAEQDWSNILKTPQAMKMLFVVAAGNSFRPLNELHVYPASLAWNRDNVISVGALNRTGDGLWHGEFRELKKGSNSGELVEVLAPGEDIPCASNVVEDKALYSRTSGSSMATALVSATASLLLERELTPREIKARLLASATPVLSSGNEGQAAAYAGKLSARRALLDPNQVHIKASNREYEHGLAEPTKSAIQVTPSDSGQAYFVSSSDVLSIMKIDDDEDGPIYRIAYFNSRYQKPGLTEKPVKIEPRTRLKGCLAYESLADHKKYLVGLPLASVCEEYNKWDSSNVINDLREYIGRSLGR